MIKSNEDFKDVYEKYLRFSMQTAYRIVRDRALAEDISQDVFYNFYRMEREVDLSNEEKLHSYVFMATVNRALDYLRKAHMKKEKSLELLERDGIADPSPGLDEFVLRMEKKRYQRLVLEKLREKDPTNYDILIKVKYWNIPPDSVAREYGMSTNALNNRISRTRAWMDRELKKLYREE